MTVRTRRRLAGAAVLIAAAVGGAVVWAVGSGTVDRFRYPLEYEGLVLENARLFALDPALIAAVIYAESRFEPDAVSHAGAIGLMQLLPETGEWIAETTGTRFRRKDLFDPETNVRYGSYYLNELLEKYGGDTRIALAAYHAGQTNADRWLADGGRITFADTRAYVRTVLSAREVYRDAYGVLAAGATAPSGTAAPPSSP